MVPDVKVAIHFFQDLSSMFCFLRTFPDSVLLCAPLAPCSLALRISPAYTLAFFRSQLSGSVISLCLYYEPLVGAWCTVDG